MCQCEAELAITFLPHQTRAGQEYGTHRHYPVAGFAENVCRACRGEPEIPSPRAAIYNQKGKVQRYYWREITKTYYESVLAWSRERGIEIENIMQMESKFSEEMGRLKKAARKHWQQRHKEKPKYDTTERTPAQFLAKISVPEVEVVASYLKERRGDTLVGKWKVSAYQTGGAEDVAVSHYESRGYQVFRCERKLISMLISVFCWPVIQDPEDPKSQLVMRGSTVGWRPGAQTTRIHFLLPEDFGSAAYYERCQDQLETLFKHLKLIENLDEVFEKLLPGATTLRDYLWVAEEDAEQLARKAIAVIPKNVIINMVKWAIGDFWNRQPGWPDLLLIRSDEYRFSEVKSPNDKLSLEQMQWFEWAITESSPAIPCELCRVVKST